MRLESRVGVLLGFANHAKDFESYLRSDGMPLKGVNKGSDNCVHFSL